MAMRRELDRRTPAGLEVVLYWHGAENVTVSVRDTSTDEEFELRVEAAFALDAFLHPYAYAAGCGATHAQPAAAS
jgi:hypothetical protein